MSDSKALTIIDVYADRRAQFNVLAPTTVAAQINPFMALHVAEVQVDPNPGSGEVYEERNAGAGKFALHARTLDKIAQAAGIMWHPTLCRVEEVRRDYVRYKAVGLIRDASGQWRFLPPGTKEIWAQDEEEEFRRSITAQKLSGSALEAYVAKQMAYANQHRLAKAETKAKNRVIRAALSIKSTYTAAELAKPFVVPVITFQPDYSDPQVRQAMLLAGARAQADLWGTPVAGIPAAVGAEAFRAPAQLGTGDMPASVPEGVGEAPPEDDNLPWDDAEAGASESTLCAACGSPIEDMTATVRGHEQFFAAPDIAEQTRRKYGKQLCWSCAQAQAKSGKGAAS